MAHNRSDPTPSRLLENGHMAIKQCKHGPMAYNVNDTFIGRSLDLYGEWGEGELELLGRLLQPGALVLDIGANIGTHTVFFAKAVGPGGVVIAFEPQRLVYQNLCTNVALNALTNVHCLHNAVGDVRGSVSIPVSRPDQAINMGAFSVEGRQQGEQVDILPVDALGLTRCNLIKLDVEGMEVKALTGAAQTIRATRPVLFVENNTTERSADIINQITDMGYDCWWQIAGYYNPNNFFGNGENIFATFAPEANMLCFPSEAKVSVPGGEAVTGPEDDWTQAVQRMMARR